MGLSEFDRFVVETSPRLLRSAFLLTHDWAAWAVWVVPDHMSEPADGG